MLPDMSHFGDDKDAGGREHRHHAEEGDTVVVRGLGV